MTQGRNQIWGSQAEGKAWPLKGRERLLDPRLKYCAQSLESGLFVFLELNLYLIFVLVIDLFGRRLVYQVALVSFGN